MYTVDYLKTNSKISSEVVLSAYIQCALWSEVDDEGTPLDSYLDLEDISPECLDTFKKDVKDFLKSAKEVLELLPPHYNLEMIGHDFWLTRNGHGAGFWDRGLEVLGHKLTAIAESYGNTDLFVGDDLTVGCQ